MSFCVAIGRTRRVFRGTAYLYPVTGTHGETQTGQPQPESWDLCKTISGPSPSQSQICLDGVKWSKALYRQILSGKVGACVQFWKPPPRDRCDVQPLAGRGSVGSKVFRWRDSQSRWPPPFAFFGRGPWRVPMRLRHLCHRRNLGFHLVLWPWALGSRFFSQELVGFAVRWAWRREQERHAHWLYLRNP